MTKFVEKSKIIFLLKRHHGNMDLASIAIIHCTILATLMKIRYAKPQT